MSKSLKHLVVDSGAFIKNAPVHEFSEHIYTVQGAIQEIKDKATLQRLQFLPYTLQIKSPSPDACKFALEYSKKTGDYSSLSATDLQIIALCYQLEKEFVGTDHINKEPTCKVTGKSPFGNNQLSGFYYPREDVNSLGEESSSEEGTLNCSADEKPTENSASVENSTEDNSNIGNISTENVSHTDSDEEGWITPNNIAEIQKKMGFLALEESTSTTVGCITTDFAIQNVLLQMGLHVVSVDGMLIKQARVFILRCYACFKTTSNITKKFCPNCGNKTLKRVAVTVNEDGTKNIHINFRRPINIRGTRYSLPMPKGGKHAVNPVLCEDQPIPQNKPPKSALQKIDALSPDYEILPSPFAKNDVYSRAALLGIRTNKSGKTKRNPNEWSKRTGNRKRN
ncbi:RNA-binding protein NOB1-like [Stegodyphus dumicola]|uniref:RNA-binding protein NOB1-like n=1 Tax=Stegodyphus dumicola TaxID=202533 RepID=UPI0015AEC237|nr:RNA-binding protein NOB1-like [Stegodyphus dumicola]